MKIAEIYLNNSHATPLWWSRIREICKPAVRYAAVTLAVVSVLVMGSDGPYFPWANLSAAGVLAIIAWRMNRGER